MSYAPEFAAALLPIIAEVVDSNFLDHNERVELAQELVRADDMRECDAILRRWNMAFDCRGLRDLDAEGADALAHENPQADALSAIARDIVNAERKRA
jgi:hypothetical protein